MKICPGCSSEFDNYTTYCSKACSNTHQPRRKRRCIDGVSTCSDRRCACQSRRVEVKTCIICGKSRGPYSKKFCGSQVCAQTGYQAEKIATDGFIKWLAGEVSADAPWGRHGIKLSNWARTYLIDQAGHKCTECGWCRVHPITGKVPLEVDHIDGDTGNNFIWNLRVLCPNCHSLTPTFRKLNKRLHADAGAEGDS